MIEFEAWPKTPRLSAERTSITEKIDGTNAAVIIESLGPEGLESFNPDPIGTTVVVDYEMYLVGAQSRKRLITPDSDNYGFANWVWSNAHELVTLLGPGRHFGEWWGQGIQRRYDMDRKVFSLFNYFRFSKIAQQWHGWRERARAINMTTVPLLHVGKFSDLVIQDVLEDLRVRGSVASAEWMSPFDRPEGIIIRHADLGGNLKAFVENDDVPKSVSEVQKRALTPLNDDTKDRALSILSKED